MLSVSQLDSISHLPDLVLCPLDSWDLVCVKGDDRIDFLQGQLTCDFNTLKVGDQTLAAQCDPQGKVLSVFRVIVLEDRVLLTQLSSVTTLQMPALQKYAAFSNVEICLETEFAIFGLAGCKSAQYIAEQVDKAATHDKSRLLGTGGVIIKQPYPSLRYMAVLPVERVESLITKLMDIAVIYDDSLWEAMNIASGIPFIEKETVGKFIPQMLNLQHLDAISFTKGCYIGQETIARAKYRGANKRSLFILTGRASVAPVIGQTIEMLVNESWKRIGTVVSGCQYGDKHIEILAVLPKECNATNIYQIKEIEGSTLYFAPLPYPSQSD